MYSDSVHGPRILDSHYPNAARDGISPKQTASQGFPSVGARHRSWLANLPWFMLQYSEADCRSLIDEYVGGADNGLTERTMRYACGLPEATSVVRHAYSALRVDFDPARAAIDELQAHHHALIKWALENNREYMTASLAKRLTNVPSWSGGSIAVLASRFQRMVDSGLWISCG